jgi:sugar transferase (PEP-CTERM/EpsH1 system associated)
MARFAMEPPLDRFPFVLDMVDVDSEKWKSLAERSTPPRSTIYRREARTLAAFERAASERARAVLVISEQERDALRAIAPGADIRVVPNGVEVEHFAPPPDAPPREPTVVFCGVMDYAPNVEGVLWFAEQVWPRVRAARADARFLIVGANPTPAIRALATADPSIEVTGRVDDVRPYLWRAAVSVAPLHVARGTQNKVLESLAAGVPAVITAAVAAGLATDTEGGCTVAGAPGDWATQLLRMLSRPADTLDARSAVLRVDWRRQLEQLRPAIQQAAADRLPAPDATLV